MIRNILFSFAGQILTFIVALLALPITVRAYGVTNYGIIALVITTLGASAILDLGLSRTTTKFVAERLAQQNASGVIDIIWSSTMLQYAIGLLLGIVGAILLPFLVAMVDVKVLASADAKAFVLIIAATLPFTLAAGSLRGALEGAQRFALVSWVKALQNCSIYLLPAICGLAHASVLHATIWLCVSRVVVFLLYLLVCASVFPSFWRFRLSRIFSNFSFWRYSGWLAVSNLVVAFHINADRFLIALWAGVAAVGYYAIPMEIVNGLSVIAGSITGVLMPAFSSLHAQPDKCATAQPVFFRGVRWVLLLLIPIVTILSIDGQPLIAMWQGDLIAANTNLPLKVALIALLVNALGWVPTALALGFGRVDIVVKLQIAQVPIILVSAWLLIPAYGATGAAMTFLIRVVFETTALYLATDKVLLPRSFKRGAAIVRFDKIALLGLLGVPLYIASALMVSRGAMGANILCYALIYTGCWWIAVADTTEKKAIKGFVVLRHARVFP